jgi:spore germination cell wall hydrolase CwlJ-like protein
VLVKRGGHQLYRRLALGIPALVLATSCVEQDASSPAAQPRLAASIMLRKLALDVPRDLALLDSLTATAGAVAAAPPFRVLAATRTPDDAARALECLTAAVYYEARSQSDDGQRAVAQVVLNRVRDRAFPSSVCGVVYQGSTRTTGCQFSFSCDGSMAAVRNEQSWAHARDIATAALSGSVYAPVGSATFYHANYVLPWWAASMDKVVTVGAHIFYRWKSGLEGALAFRQPYGGFEPSLSGRTSPLPGLASAYGEQETVGSVVIHRGALATATVSVSSTPARSIVSGVRIHRGVAAPVSNDDLSDSATISD